MTTQLKPWGTHKVIFDTSDFVVKYIFVDKGHRTSLQKHKNRSENWIVLEGHPVITKGKAKLKLSPDDSIYIPLGEIHRIDAAHDDVKIIEVQHGICDENDIERIADDYER